MSFFLYLLQIMTILTARVEWIHDWISVPVFSNIEQYRYLPEAKLYIDDYWVVGAKVEYERNGVEWTFISTVNTNQVRRYQIKYRAYFPDYHEASIRIITFDVVDEVSPTILSLPEKRMNIGEKLPDFKEGVVVSDNYYQSDVITISVDTSKVMTSVVGYYPVIYHISDPSGNTISREVMFQVIDPLPPVITFNKAIKINVYQTFAWQSFISIKDNVDLVLTIEVEDKDVHYDQIGVYQASIIATDRSGNQTVETFMIEVLDLEAPLLKLKSKPPNLVVYQPIDRMLLESYIIEIGDNHDQLNMSDVKITHDIETDVLGTYTIYYELSDDSGNMVHMSLLIKVVDDVKPVITIITPFVFEVYSPDPLFLGHIEFTDNFTPRDSLVYKITSSPKMNTVGRYPISIEVSDTSGNKAIYQDYIHIVDTIPPTIKQLNDIVITSFEKKDLTHYFSISDQYDKNDDILLELHDQNVIYDVIGSYEATMIARDKSNNEFRYFFEIMVIDMIEPFLEIKQDYYVHDLGKPEIDLYSFIDIAYDNYDSLSISDVNIIHDINWDVMGKYVITYTLSDQSMNKTEVYLTMIIDDRTPPELFMQDLIIEQGSTFSLTEGLEASDNNGTPQVHTFPETISTHEAGTYIITYIAVDTRGNYVIADRKITIMPIEQSYTITSFIPMAILLVAGCSILYILYKKG